MIEMMEIAHDVYVNDFYKMELERDEEGFISKAEVVGMSESLPVLTCRFYDAKWYCDIKYQTTESVNDNFIKDCKHGQDTSYVIERLLNLLEEDSAIDYQFEIMSCNY